MLDILILYSLYKREMTFYGLAKSIAEQFGEISIPSHGALHPAVKRLADKKLISLRKKMSDGGKRYSYYAVTDNFREGFNELFMKFNSSSSETVEAFLLTLKARLLTIELLDEGLLSEFKEKSILRLNNYEAIINNKLNNTYLEFNNLQKKITELYLREISEYKNIISQL